MPKITFDALAMNGPSNYPDYFLTREDPTELAIVDALIRTGLSRGWAISIYDGEELSLRRSTSYSAITHEIAATDVTELRFWSPTPRIDGRPLRIGSVMLVHGNDGDVIADCTDNLTMTWLTRIAMYANGEERDWRYNDIEAWLLRRYSDQTIVPYDAMTNGGDETGHSQLQRLMSGMFRRYHRPEWMDGYGAAMAPDLTAARKAAIYDRAQR